MHPLTPLVIAYIVPLFIDVGPPATLPIMMILAGLAFALARSGCASCAHGQSGRICLLGLTPWRKWLAPPPGRGGKWNPGWWT